jgi:7-cyano-7-deazaguanine synthase
MNIDLRVIGGSALTSDIDVPKNRNIEKMLENIPVTYVPARNTIFLSYALAWAEVIGANDIFIGVNVTDYSGYPDCRPKYIKAYEKMANLATKVTVSGKQKIIIQVPLIKMSKAQIIQKGIELGVDYSLTHSCYDPTSQGRACGKCDACLLRLKGFRDAGMKDPIPYRR